MLWTAKAMSGRFQAIFQTQTVKILSRVSIVSPCNKSPFSGDNALKLADEVLFNYPRVFNEAGVRARKQEPWWAPYNLWFQCRRQHQPWVLNRHTAWASNQLLNGRDLCPAEHWTQWANTKGVGHGKPVKGLVIQSFLEQAFTRSGPRDSEADRAPSLPSSYKFWNDRWAPQLPTGQCNQELWSCLQWIDGAPGEGPVSSTWGNQEMFRQGHLWINLEK